MTTSMMERNNFVNCSKTEHISFVFSFNTLIIILGFLISCHMSSNTHFTKMSKEELAGSLKSDDPLIKKNSILHLLLINANDKADEAALLLEDKDPEVRSLTARFLGACKSSKHTDDVAKLLNDPATDKLLVVIALEDLNARKYASKIAKLLRVEYNVNTLSEIIKLLDRWGSIECAGEIARFLEQPLNTRPSLDERVAVISACKALGSMKSIDHVKVVANYIWDANVAIQNAAVKALGKMNAIEYKNELIKLQEVIKKERGLIKEIRKNYRAKGVDVEKSIDEILTTWKAK